MNKMRSTVDFHNGWTVAGVMYEPVLGGDLSPVFLLSDGNSVQQLQNPPSEIGGHRCLLKGEPIPPGYATFTPRDLDQIRSSIDPADLYRRMVSSIKACLYFPEENDFICDVLALFALHTHLLFSETAVYLHVTGRPATGKSRLLEVLARVAFVPQLTCSTTKPNIFRRLDSSGGTLMLDEMEHVSGNSDKHGDLLDVLRGGYRRSTGVVQRLDTAKDSFDPVDFDCFGPKVFGSIGPLEEAMSQRCIQIPTYLMPRDEVRKIPERVPWPTPVEFLQLSLWFGPPLSADWLVRHQDTLRREDEVWSPLLFLAQWLEERGVHGLRSRIDQAKVSLKQETPGLVDETRSCLFMSALFELRRKKVCPSPKEVGDRAAQRFPQFFDEYPQVSGRLVSSCLKSRFGMRTDGSSRRPKYQDTLSHIKTMFHSRMGISLEDWISDEGEM